MAAGIRPKYRAPSYLCSPYSYICPRLTDNELVVLGEIICWNLEVQRSRSFPDTAGDIVVRTVARAEPTAEVACLANRDTTKMCADTCGR